MNLETLVRERRIKNFGKLYDFDVKYTFKKSSQGGTPVSTQGSVLHCPALEYLYQANRANERNKEKTNHFLVE